MGFIKCVVYAAAVGFGSFLLGRILPASWFQEDRFPYKEADWEQGGSIYNTLFHIRIWQAKVPDMSRIFPALIPAKKVTGNLSRELPRMIAETCIAEGIHWFLCLAIIPCLWIWPGTGGILFTIFYILGNLPFILIQRYNRPRFVHLRNKFSGREERKEVSLCQP